MNQDKLEEIARLLGGISDKLDVVVGSLTAEQRLDMKEEMEKIAKKRERVRARTWEPVPSGGYVATLSTSDADQRSFARYGSHSALEDEK